MGLLRGVSRWVTGQWVMWVMRVMWEDGKGPTAIFPQAGAGAGCAQTGCVLASSSPLAMTALEQKQKARKDELGGSRHLAHPPARRFRPSIGSGRKSYNCRARWRLGLHEYTRF